LNSRLKTRPELLAPAGNFEKLEMAIHFGADAIYLGGEQFSLRNYAGNFTVPEMKTAVQLAHRQGVKVYVTVNVYARSDEFPALEAYLQALSSIAPDALIISDPGILVLARKTVPQIPIHFSTQANTTNAEAARFWASLGVSRINVARELSLAEIKTIIDNTHVQIETFIHGAMCISYSGRCLLSSFMAGRDSNRGQCAHPCRWQYHVVEQKRPDQYFPVTEDDRGTYLFSSKDLCMLPHLPELIESGIAAFKIEGRMKSIHYLASTVKTYRQALDLYAEDPAAFKVRSEWINELNRTSLRGTSTGFYFENPPEALQNYQHKSQIVPHQFLGKILEQLDTHRYMMEVRNKIFTGEAVEVLSPQGPAVADRIEALISEEGQMLEFAQPNSTVSIVLGQDYAANDLIRKRPLNAT
jgi:putative protease